jgi:hypothetical protein
MSRAPKGLLLDPGWDELRRGDLPGYRGPIPEILTQKRPVTKSPYVLDTGSKMCQVQSLDSIIANRPLCRPGVR